MMSPSNLIRSNKGVELLPEICLRVGELLIDEAPKSVGNLLLSSKSLYNLLKTYETSITKTLSQGSYDLNYLDCCEKSRSLKLREGSHSILKKYSYPWLLEMRNRNSIVNDLMRHDLTRVIEPEFDWLIIDGPEEEIMIRLREFKSRSLGLLFMLSDCSSGIYASKVIRDKQIIFLESLCATDLAYISVMAELMGSNFAIMVNKSKLASEILRALQSSSDAQAVSSFPDSTEVSLPDPVYDNFTSEATCVFENHILRHGPKFASAYFQGSSRDSTGIKLKFDTWAHQKLLEGFCELHAFELGYSSVLPSMQSVVWAIFRQKMKCTSENSWNLARRLVEGAMSPVEAQDGSAGAGKLMDG